MYTLYKFHILNGISEINQLFDDILIIWPAPVCIYIYIYIYIYLPKVIVHPKKRKFDEMYLPSGHPRCRRVYLSEQIWRYWESNENENPNSWEKHHNNPQVIHKTPVDHLMSCKVNTVAACHKTLNDWLESCGLLWCFYHLFELSFWRHPFTTEDTLVSKWCNAKFINLLWWRNKLIHILDRLRVTQFSAIFYFF